MEFNKDEQHLANIINIFIASSHMRDKSISKVLFYLALKYKNAQRFSNGKE